jgi:hypothetical protein
VKVASDVRRQLVLASLRQEIEAMVPLVRQVMNSACLADTSPTARRGCR